MQAATRWVWPLRPHEAATEATVCPRPAPCPPLPACSLQSALNLVQDPSDQGQAVRNACILVGMLLAFRLGIYWTLRRKTRA